MAGRIIFNENQRVITGTGIPDTLLPLPQNISLTSTTQTYTSISQNLSVETRSMGVQRWQLDLSWPPLNREDAMKVYSFFISQQGTFDSFMVKLPAPVGTTNGTQVNRVNLCMLSNGTTISTADQNACTFAADAIGDGVTGIYSTEGEPMVTDIRTTIARSVDVGNFNPSKTDALKAGDFFKFSNHEKLYMVTRDLEVSSNGTGTIFFTPPLLSSVASGTVGTELNADPDLFLDGTTIIYSDADIACSLTNDDFEIPIDEHIHYAMNASLGERVTSTNNPN